MALFLSSTLPGPQRVRDRAFPIPPTGHTLIVGPGHWDELRSSTTYRDKKLADQISYFRDELLQNFGELVHQGTAPNPMNVELPVLERIGRYIASETRFHRRNLAAAFVELGIRVDRDRVTYRTIFSRHSPQMAYVFRFSPPIEGGEEAQEELRYDYAFAYGHHTLKRTPSISTVVVIATNATPEIPGNYNFVLVHRRPPDPELDALVNEMAVEHGWAMDVSDLEQKPHWLNEFPRLTRRDNVSRPWRSAKRERDTRRKAQRLARRKSRH